MKFWFDKNKFIAIGSDHAGFALKEKIKKYIEKLGLNIVDFGTFSLKRVDYPDYGCRVVNAVKKNDKFACGIIICATGIGISIVANKFPNIYAALCYSPKTAYLSRAHNNSNILALGGRVTPFSVAKKIVKVWLTTNFKGRRHKKRLKKISKIERELFCQGR
jgi:ribose 5-phosphate isomerase B